MADEPTLSAADLQMRHNLDGAPDPFPTIADSPKISRKALSSAPIDVGSESAFPSLGSSGPATTKAPTTTWSGPKLKAAQANLMLVESFTLTVMDLSTAGKDGKPTTLGEIMKQVMAKHKVKVEASSNQRTHQTTFNVKSESQKELDKAKRMLLALLSPVVTVTVDAPTSTIPHIIGPKGANLNSIREQTGVKIDIPKRDTLSAPNGSTVASHAASPVPPVDDDDEEPTITVSITGPKSAAYEAQELVNRIIAQKRSKATQRVRDIPTHVLPFVKSQRAKFEAAAQGGVVELKLDQAAREISVSGDRPTVLSVIDVIRGTVEEYTTGLQSIKTSLPKRQHRLLTGKNADDIMRESKCTVVIADPDDEDNEITIWGKSDDIGNGITAALSKANSQYIHEFPLPGSAAASRQLATYMTHIKYPETLSNAHSGVHVYLPSPVAIQRLQSVSLDIIGDKPLVDAAVRQVSELVGKLILATDEAEVDWLVHRILQNTKNGKKLKELSQTHNVRIFFPPESQERSAVLLVYDPTSPNASSNPNEKGKNLKAVKTELLKLAKESADVKSDTITVDPKWHQAVLGHNGTTLNAIIGEDKSVSIKFGQDGSDVVHIHGTSSEVDRAVNEIHRIVEKAKNDEIENSYVTEFDIDREYVSRIVGTGGSGVNRIRDQLGVQLDLSNESQDRDKKKPGEKTHVKITGRKENVEEAKKRILAQAERIADEVSETIKIPAQYHSALIGQGGKYAIRLEDNYNVKVTFPRHGESGEGRTREPLKADEVLIKGGRKGVAHAKKELLDALEVEKENSSEIKFTIPRRAVPRVLGRGGATIKDIKDDTGTQIDVDKEAGETTTIVIKGSKFDVQEAKARILEISSQVGEESTDTVIIESKLHRAIIGAGGQGLRDLIARAGGPPEPRQQVGLIRFPPAGEGASDEIHLRGEPKVIAKLKVELEKAAADIRDRIIVGVEIPVALHRVLIGRGGQHLNDLQTRTNTQVQFPGSRSYNTVGEMTNASELADADPANIVKVLGRKADCEKAIADLKTSATKEVRAPRPQRAPRPSTPGDVTATVTVPLKYHHIISNQGQFFRNLRSLGVNVDHSTVPPKSSVSRPSADADGARIDDDEGGDSGVRLQIIPNYQDGPEGDAEWTLKARDQENLERAQKRLQDAIDQASRMTHIGFLSGIEKSAFPRIIGSKGATISRLRDETGADINVGKEDDVITIAGSQAAIEHAKEEIVKITTRPRGGRRDD